MFQCEKLRKKRSSLVGAFVSTHGKSIDDVDRSIVEARTALNEVTQELQVGYVLIYLYREYRIIEEKKKRKFCAVNSNHTNVYLIIFIY